jgi:hypothetical protein
MRIAFQEVSLKGMAAFFAQANIYRGVFEIDFFGNHQPPPGFQALNPSQPAKNQDFDTSIMIRNLQTYTKADYVILAAGARIFTRRSISYQLPAAGSGFSLCYRLRGTQNGTILRRKSGSSRKVTSLVAAVVR